MPNRSRVATPTPGRIMAGRTGVTPIFVGGLPMCRGRWLGVLVVAAACVGASAADDPKPLMDAKAFDKLVVDTLRDVHDRGADLYNTKKDYPGAYRLYQGSLLTV